MKDARQPARLVGSIVVIIVCPAAKASVACVDTKPGWGANVDEVAVRKHAPK
jgi:hypothetical protein